MACPRRGRARLAAVSGARVIEVPGFRDVTSYASVGIGRFSRMLSYIHSCRRILGGAPLVPATHDAGIEPRYVPNLSSASASS